jgi:C-terminal AAA-associated domain
MQHLFQDAMALRTEDFPQADKLNQVAMVADAVKSGRDSDHEIESFIGLDSENRQGRYYRKAAELLGLITTYDNHSQLTALGKSFTQLATQQERTDFLATLLTSTELFATIGRFIADKKPSESELRSFLIELYPGKSSTASRRISSIRAYLRDANLAVFVDGRLVPGPVAGGALVKRVREEEPATRYKFALEGNNTVAVPTPEHPIFDAETYSIEVDLAKHERAVLTHRKLVDAKATFLHAHGLSAKQTRLIDLFSEGQPGLAIYEMKSLSGENFVAQMRRAVSQLYEYRYAYQAQTARMCIVTNRPPASTELAYVEYLESDRRMAYVWTEDFASFACLQESAALLGGFAP